MNPYYPIYTEQPECQDCYKCVRACPVKAIHIEQGKASVMEERCVLCGHCVQVCPVGAKRVRNDIGRVKRLLSQKKAVYVSLAPSFVSEFSHARPRQIIRALKQLGFAGVSETALGAQEVSAHMGDQLKKNTGKIYISSACPTVVQYIKKYVPELSDRVNDLFSPVLAHAGMLRREYGDDIAVVFIGPCISKMHESDEYRDLLNVALTFDTLRAWFDAEGINLQNQPADANDSFVPEPAQEGALYPIDGGMIAGIKANCSVNDATFMSFSGLGHIKQLVNDLPQVPPDSNICLELLACAGGCVNGPGSGENLATAMKRYNLIQYTSYPEMEIPRQPTLDIRNTYRSEPVREPEYSEKDIRDALARVGKYSTDDELNCGGCGYDSCREFAAAMLGGKAEREMCVSYMRQLANKKANALLRSMPSGVVIVNDQLRIVECNRNFARLLGEETSMVFEANPGMQNALLERVIPFADYFKAVLQSGEDIVNKDIKYDNHILNVSIFSIEMHQIVGAVIQDVTAPAMQKEQIIKRTRDVIDKNLQTVQKVAYLLGENASETETMLDSIVQSFSAERVEGDT
ncbi:MAG: [Fe-Fe] hydrogenase large subunit C-terminal domain-containing protein [candidate division KSB1 bacterium]|nr:[Fe-Fe] hydrogenase large subunit C-terminal domain-containing protein [candidate division KSB1 bacterium]